MLFIFSIIYTFLEYIYQSIFYKEISTKNYINRLFILNKYLLNWSIDTSLEDTSLENIKDNNRILAMFTHPKILDGFFVLKYLTDKYPDHKIIFVVKKELINLHFIGKFINENYLCLERKLEKDEPYIRQRLKYFMSKYPKIVIAIFPEGTTYCKE